MSHRTCGGGGRAGGGRVAPGTTWETVSKVMSKLPYTVHEWQPGSAAQPHGVWAFETRLAVCPNGAPRQLA